MKGLEVKTSDNGVILIFVCMRLLSIFNKGGKI